MNSEFNTKKQYTLVPFTDWCYHYALFFIDGNFIGKKKIDTSKKTIKFKDRLFNFYPDKATKFKLMGAFWYNKYYIYDLNNPDPIVIDNNPSILFDSKTYRNVIDSDLIKKINQGENGFLFSDLLKPMNLLMIVVLMGIVYFISKGGLT